MAEEEEEKHEEEHKPEHHEPGEGKGGKNLLKNKWVWVGAGVVVIGGIAFVVMSGGGSGGQQQQPQNQTSAANTNPYPVDSSSMYGAGGTVGSAGPSWYNANSPENLDYWPYVPVSTSGSSSGSSGSSSSSGKKSGSGSSKSGSGSSKGSSGGSSSSGGHKGSTGGTGRKGGTTHGKGSTGTSSGKSTSGSSGKHSKGVTPNPHAGGAHGYVYTAKSGDTLASLASKWWGSNPNTIWKYGNNQQIIKQGLKSGAINKKTGQIKPGFKINA